MSRALVVDDDAGVLSLITRWLGAAGYDVATATTFKAALDLMRTDAFDVLVADVRLGDFNGLNLAIFLRQTRPDARVLMISGWDDAVLRKDAADLGAGYLCKPLDQADLLAAIERSPKRP